MRRTHLGLRRPAVLTVALLVSMGLALPALAERPSIMEGGVTFPDVNPCSPTGDSHDVTINFVARIHEHRNNLVITSKRTGLTSSGFVMVNGTEHIVVNGNQANTGLTDIWRHPEAGQRFIASFALEFDPETFEPIRLIRGSLRCLSS